MVTMVTYKRHGVKSVFYHSSSIFQINISALQRHRLCSCESIPNICKKKKHPNTHLSGVRHAEYCLLNKDEAFPTFPGCCPTLAHVPDVPTF